MNLLKSSLFIKSFFYLYKSKRINLEKKVNINRQKKGVEKIMIKIFNKVGIITILTLSFFVYNNYNVDAFTGENKVDLLIENKEQQEILKAKIYGLEDKLERNMKHASNNIEVISLSFIPGDKDTSLNDSIDMELINLYDDKDDLEQELQNLIIEGVKLEKTIEEETIDYLDINNLDFLPGLWPLESYNEISSYYGQRIHPITNEISFHKGIDIPAPENTDILASDNGTVIFSGVQNGYGNVVKIKHFDGKITVYAHNTYNTVAEGEIVKRGQMIAKVGSTGDSTGNHVHFETIVNDENINPINLLSK